MKSYEITATFWSMGRLFRIYGEYVEPKSNTQKDSKNLVPQKLSPPLSKEWSTARRWERQRPTALYHHTPPYVNLPPIRAAFVISG